MSSRATMCMIVRIIDEICRVLQYVNQVLSAVVTVIFFIFFLSIFKKVDFKNIWQRRPPPSAKKQKKKKR